MKSALLVSHSITPTPTEMDLFGQRGIDLLLARNAADAMDVIATLERPLIISELDLPDIPGDELCTRIKARSPEAYVILACQGKERELKRCGRCGADAYIQTPLDYNALANRLSATLNAEAPRATRVLVRAKVEGTIKSEPFFCLSHNISTTGMMLETEKVLARNDNISCSFFLPDNQRLATTCKVVRVIKSEGKDHMYGLEFQELAPENTSIISSFIQSEREKGNFF